MQARTVVLCILDGWGTSTELTGNAPLLAHTPTIDKIMRECPNATLITHGQDVGLPRGQMGNSEVGHMNIGAGRVVNMDLGRINSAIKNGTYAANPALDRFLSRIKVSGGKVHLMSLLSDGGVHGHISHLSATMKILHENKLTTALHVIADGRDVAPSSIKKFLHQLYKIMPSNTFVASLTGRYYALDRDNRWDRIKKAYDAMILGKAEMEFQSIEDAVTSGYNKSLLDEFLPACTIGNYEGANDGDGFFCMNFRADRARQLISAINDPNFQEFDVSNRPYWAAVLGMVSYSNQHDLYMGSCFPKQNIKNTLGEWIAKYGKSQFRLAETEKYPHVTYFFNGGQEAPLEKEQRLMPASPRVPTYDLKPEMSSKAVTNSLIKAIKKNFDLVVVNYANPDMVGHSGNLKAAVMACEAVDRAIAEVLPVLKSTASIMLLTADHGNCESMIDLETGLPHTAHTTNPVLISLVNGPDGVGLSNGGKLSDVAPTILSLMRIPPPQEMTGRSLLC